MSASGAAGQVEGEILALYTMNSPIHHSFSKYLLNVHYILGPVFVLWEVVLNERKHMHSGNFCFCPEHR